ncbi:uncharacterized protein FPRO_12532 [Fusarium proliferatum ET1]|uniref:Uncharacterized protein n=1 Tax=Fusarium proliferatum (strain ET1) TaxID=1227346 RepID=A0A1L7W934_FUSPR|nr:uncharacterized protein FPRO_12532 [Fusarium proliferatum ET1]CZR49095.1 uncharacterized protein FPRO_12532 [Fusarium proliferatum ET1]
MSPFKDPNPRQDGKKAKSYPNPDKMDIEGWLSTLPPSACSPRTMPQSTQHSKRFGFRDLLCAIWLTIVSIFTVISVFSSVDIVKMLAWRHRDDIVLSFYFKFSQLFLQSYFKLAQWKNSANYVPEMRYWGIMDLRPVISLCIVPCAVIYGVGRLFDHLFKN